MSNQFAQSVTRSYGKWFGEPTRSIRFDDRQSPVSDAAVLVYLPSEKEQKDVDGNITMWGSAGLSAFKLCKDARCEFALEITGNASVESVEAMAKALFDLAIAPLVTGRVFERNQILRNLALPGFERFSSALLVDWDPLDGFLFPSPSDDVGLLRVLPIFESEIKFIESEGDRSGAYLTLFNRGLVPEDPEREPAV